jgi:hypothetical protein
VKSVSTTLSAPRSRPWYREPWPWFLISLPATAVVAGLVTVWIAYRSADGLVVGDYYKAGLAINQTLERDELARKLDLAATINLVGETLQVDLSGRLEQMPPNVKVHLAHPTRQGADQVMDLAHAGNGHYRGALSSELADGKWLIQVEDPETSWRLNGVLHTPMTEAAVLRFAGATE